MIKKTFIQIVLLALGILSCKPQYDFIPNDIPPKLVLWGYNQPDSVVKVKLMRTSNPLENLQPDETVISDAEIILFENQIAIDTFKYDENGWYIADSSINLDIHQVYHVTASKEGFEKITSLPDSMPPVPEIDSIWVSDSVRPIYLNDIVQSEHQIKIYLKDSFRNQTYIGYSTFTILTNGSYGGFNIKNDRLCTTNPDEFLSDAVGISNIGAYFPSRCVENPMTLYSNNYIKGEVDKSKVSVCFIASSAYPYHLQLSNMDVNNNSFIDILPEPTLLDDITMQNGYGYFGCYHCTSFEVQF